MIQSDLGHPPEEEAAREGILELLNQTFRTAMGRSSQSLTISRIKRELRTMGYHDCEIVGALTFLVDVGWIREEHSERKFFIKGRLATSDQITYRISDVGVVHFSGPSKFTSAHRFSGINITNVNGITIVGHDNLVQVRYKELFEALEELGQVLRASLAITDDEKVELQSDLATIQSQLTKAEPDKSIVKRAWTSLTSRLPNSAEVTKLIPLAAVLIKSLTGI